jgi:hypothetical protein
MAADEMNNSKAKIDEFKAAIGSIDRWTMKGCYNFLKESSSLKKQNTIASILQRLSQLVTTGPPAHSRSTKIESNVRREFRSFAGNGNCRQVGDRISRTEKADTLQKEGLSETKRPTTTAWWQRSVGEPGTIQTRATRTDAADTDAKPTFR